MGYFLHLGDQTMTSDELQEEVRAWGEAFTTGMIAVWCYWLIQKGCE